MARHPSPTTGGFFPVLDPRTLGRPVHLLGVFAERFGADLADALRRGPNRRYGTAFEVAEAGLAQPPLPLDDARWKVYGTPAGQVGVAIDRALVLRLLQCRYGVREAQDPAVAPPSTTEERLAQKLGLQWVEALAARLRIGLPGAGVLPPPAPTEPVSWLGEALDPVGGWVLSLRVREAATGLDAPLRFALDETWMRELLAGLAAGRPAARDSGRDEHRPLASRLPVRLVAQLLQRRMTLGEVMALRVGDVIPVSLPATEVRVKDARLFTATVAEHKGKLWLMAFDDIH